MTTRWISLWCIEGINVWISIAMGRPPPGGNGRIEQTVSTLAAKTTTMTKTMSSMSPTRATATILTPVHHLPAQLESLTKRSPDGSRAPQPKRYRPRPRLLPPLSLPLSPLHLHPLLTALPGCMEVPLRNLALVLQRGLTTGLVCVVVNLVGRIKIPIEVVRSTGTTTIRMINEDIRVRDMMKVTLPTPVAQYPLHPGRPAHIRLAIPLLPRPRPVILPLQLRLRRRRGMLHGLRISSSLPEPSSSRTTRTGYDTSSRFTSTTLTPSTRPPS